MHVLMGKRIIYLNVLGKNGRLLFILSDGSRDRIPVFLSFNRTFSFIRLFDIIRSINTFHVANDLSTQQGEV